MVKANVYAISRSELRRILVAFGMSERNIVNLFATLDKEHQHVNVISLTAMLQKSSLDRDSIANIFRRLGMDDILINDVFNIVDEQKITVETGRIFEATLELS